MRVFSMIAKGVLGLVTVLALIGAASTPVSYTHLWQRPGGYPGSHRAFHLRGLL